MKKIILFFMFLLAISGFNQPVSATESVYFDFSFKTFHEDNGQNLEDVDVQIFENGQLIKTLRTARDGRAFFHFELNKEYDVVVGGNSKFIEKKIKVDTRNIDLKNWKYSKARQFKYKYEISIKLFEKESCEDFTFLAQKPIIHLQYSIAKKDIVDLADNTITRQIKRERRKNCDKKKVAIF
jgi:hypothetical protein